MHGRRHDEGSGREQVQSDILRTMTPPTMRATPSMRMREALSLKKITPIAKVAAAPTPVQMA